MQACFNNLCVLLLLSASAHRPDAQVAILSRTDMLIGMHGAALTGVIFLPAHAALVELWSTTEVCARAHVL